jgi:hypothetical protein
MTGRGKPMQIKFSYPGRNGLTPIGSISTGPTRTAAVLCDRRNHIILHYDAKIGLLPLKGQVPFRFKFKISAIKW